MKVRLVPAHELGSSEWLRWSDLQRGNPSLASPFFRPEFTNAIASAQADVFVGILESGAGIDGFFPFQSPRPGFGVPVGPRLSDYHGVICAEEVHFDPRELVTGCGLLNWQFDHVPAAQTAFTPYASSRSESPQIDLSNGFEAFVRERPQAGARPFRRLADLRRRLARDHGPLRFQFVNRHRPDLEKLLRLKSDQYARTRSAPLFQLPGVLDALDALWSSASDAFSSVLSTVHAGDTLVAAHFGLRTDKTLHWWFPVYEPRLAHYSPGLLLLLSIAEQAAQLGIRTIDLGKGAERYKRRFANRSNEVLQGRVDGIQVSSDAQRALPAARAFVSASRSPLSARESVELTPTLAELRNTWDALGATDPLWAISMRPDRKYQTWDLDEFFASGESEIAADLRHVKRLGMVVGTASALDFGCGIGRITQSLARRFERVVGVDVSPRLIAEARRLDTGERRATYFEQRREDLSAFADGSFDFVYCCNVLYAMPTQLGLQYLREFMRVVAPGGVVFFQIPVEFRDQPSQLPPEAFRAEVSFAAPASLGAGQATILPVTVRNTSPRRWPASFCDGRTQDLRVGNHWLDDTGRVVVPDDGRAHLPKPLRPGESVTVPLNITAPDTPGHYVLQADVVVEGVAWFAGRGSPVPSVAVEVTASAPQAPPQVAPGMEPVMATHVIPRSLIEQAIVDGGGQLIDAREDARAGAVWRSVQFTVVKQATDRPLRKRTPTAARGMRRDLDDPRGVILMYHRVTALPSDTYGLAVHPERFREHLEILQRNYCPLALDELVEAARVGDIPDDAVAITFDDGYLDNLTTASPLLVEAGLPATFFLTTDGLDEQREYWWDATERIFLGDQAIPSSLDLYGDGRWVRSTATAQERAEAHTAINEVIRPASPAYQRRLLDRIVAWSGLHLAPRDTHRRLVTEEVRTLAARPLHTIGAHSARHLWLPTQTADVQRYEVRESKQTLERLLAKPIHTFAYPYGAVDELARSQVDEAGFTNAVTVRPGQVRTGTDRLLLPRIEIRDSDADTFAARLNATLLGVTD
jgi:CelD/BcsL family acetyltransferase involved in cellulose biosynthesis/peptidoglycan/xylan/chitin deacetylase (PgdA/CDA1 family)/ubiquinone/menaquinone biosynthesis C-methylase UbiE